MLFRCGCGYETEDDLDFLAHLTECESKPEEHWGTYIGVMETTELPFRNSEILEENNGKKKT